MLGVLKLDYKEEKQKSGRGRNFFIVVRAWILPSYYNYNLLCQILSIVCPASVINDTYST